MCQPENNSQFIYQIRIVKSPSDLRAGPSLQETYPRYRYVNSFRNTVLIGKYS